MPYELIFLNPNLLTHNTISIFPPLLSLISSFFPYNCVFFDPFQSHISIAHFNHAFQSRTFQSRISITHISITHFNHAFQSHTFPSYLSMFFLITSLLMTFSMVLTYLLTSSDFQIKRGRREATHISLTTGIDSIDLSLDGSFVRYTLSLALLHSPCLLSLFLKETFLSHHIIISLFDHIITPSHSLLL